MKPTGKQIRQAIEYWRIALGLDDWAYTIRIGVMPQDEWGEADVDVPYKKVRFRCYPKRMHEEGEGVDEFASHEWGHRWTEELAAYAHKLCKTDAQRKDVSDLEEKMATDIGRTFLRLHKRP